MKKMKYKITWFLIFAVLTIFATTHNILSQPKSIGKIAGRIVDVKTQKPLRNANVFLNNTMLGDATDKNGRYEIQNIPFGMYELTVSMIGYEVQSRQVRVINTIKIIENFHLQPKILKGKQVTITAMDPATRAKYMKVFQRIFLGASHEELKCKLLNPHIVKLRYADSTRVLEAFADDPLEIENRATGYKINFILDEFKCEMIAASLSFTFRGRAQFIQLKPKNNTENEIWQRNQLIAYHGSLRHFFTALATGRIYESGFNIYRTANPSSVKTTQLDIPKIKTSPRDILFATVLPNYNRLKYDDFLEVTYNLEGDPQTSWLSLNKKYAILDTSGAIIEPFDPTNVRGHWAFESLTELLPRDFNPDQSAKTRPVYVADTRDYYKEGRELANMGNWNSALRTWQIGKDVLDIQTKYNPKLGFSFIELATANNATEFFEEACQIYYWTLSQENYKTFKQDIAAEVDRIAPLLKNEMAKAWQKDAKKGRPELLQKIKTFWIEKDPTPTTVLNERLIEHWQRIA
ncbi:MAG: carboxypeptidase-like regulatory domain-containing protein, partial [bacterium]